MRRFGVCLISLSLGGIVLSPAVAQVVPSPPPPSQQPGGWAERWRQQAEDARAVRERYVPAPLLVPVPLLPPAPRRPVTCTTIRTFPNVEVIQCF